MGTAFDRGTPVTISVLGADNKALLQKGTGNGSHPEDGILLTFDLPADPTDPTTTEVPGVDVFLTAKQIGYFAGLLGL